MSNWSHVSAVFRIDMIDYDKWDETKLDEKMGELSEDEFDRYVMETGFGKECLWGADSSVWKDAKNHPDKYLPIGSEGSLRMLIWRNPNKYSMATWTVTIFGDLRDHDSMSEIIEWFKHKCDLFVIRNACCTVTNELYGIRTITYVSEHKFIEIKM